jgi:hypothetical protein
MYSWQNDDASNMNAIIQNNKLKSKAQFGLKWTFTKPDWRAKGTSLPVFKSSLST